MNIWRKKVLKSNWNVLKIRFKYIYIFLKPRFLPTLVQILSSAVIGPMTSFLFVCLFLLEVFYGSQAHDKIVFVVLKQGTSKARKCDVIWENLSHGAKLIFWVIGIKWKCVLSSELFTWISCDTGIKSYWCSHAIKNKENIRIMMLISFILQFHLLRHVTGFPRSDHKWWLRCKSTIVKYRYIGWKL